MNNTTENQKVELTQEQKNERSVIALKKKGANGETQFLLTERKIFGAISIIINEKMIDEKVVFEKINTEKFNLPFGEVECIKGLYTTNKSNRRYFSLVGGKNHILARIPISAKSDIKFADEIAKTFTTSYVSYEVKDAELSKGTIEGFKYFIIPVNYKYGEIETYSISKKYGNNSKKK